MIYLTRNPEVAWFTLHAETLVCSSFKKEEHLAITHKGEVKKLRNEDFIGFVFFGEMLVWP